MNFSVKVGHAEELPSYEGQIKSFVQTMGAKDIASYLEEEANLRNKILYASSDGYPDIGDLKPVFLEDKTSHVMNLLQAYLLIKPWHEIQPYVQDALGAFLAMIGVMEFNAAGVNEG